MRWVEVEIDGIRCFMEDFIKTKEELERHGIKVSYSYIDSKDEEVEPNEIIENYRNFLKEFVKKFGDQLREQRIKYIVIMGLSEYARYKPKRAITIGINTILALYTRKPKFIQDVRPYT